MGRRRKAGARTKSGKLSRAYKGPARDPGSHEAQAKRQALVGDANDPVLSATAPGILFANGHLDRDQYNEALEFRSLRCVLYGAPWPNVSYGLEIQAITLMKVKEKFDGRVAVLTDLERHVVTDVCVFDRIPNWFFVDRLKLKRLPEDSAEQATLIDGLNALLGRRSGREAA